MIKNIWFDLPSKDLPRAKEFFLKIGFSVNECPGSENDLVSLHIGEKEIVLNLFPEDVFKNVVQNPLVDTSKGSEVNFSLGVESREEVDELAKKVTDAGGHVYFPPQVIQGWMYGCGFADLDGHRWFVLYMEMG